MHMNSRILNTLFFSGVVAKRSLEPVWENGVQEFWSIGGERCEMLRVVAQKSAKVHEVSRKFAQIRAVVTRCYAFLRVGPFFSKSERLEACLDVNGMSKR